MPPMISSDTPALVQLCIAKYLVCTSWGIWALLWILEMAVALCVANGNSGDQFCKARACSDGGHRRVYSEVKTRHSCYMDGSLHSGNSPMARKLH